MQNSGLQGLVPPSWWTVLKQSLSDPTWQPHVEGARRAPLPELAVRFYTGAGCWLLADGLYSLTGLPIGAELNPWGRAIHGFVVDRGDLVDALGRRSLCDEVRTVEAVGGSIHVDVGLEDVLATLNAGGPLSQQGAVATRDMLASAEYRECAAAASARVAAAAGLVAPE